MQELEGVEKVFFPDEGAIVKLTQADNHQDNARIHSARNSWLYLTTCRRLVATI